MLGECDEVDAGTLHASFRRPSPAFSLQNLRYALAAADYGSFRRAAEALLLRQSTLSRCVRQLEELIGMAVFERSSGGVRATQAGRQFLRSARSILEQVEALAARTQSTGRGEAGRLTVGFYTSLAAGNLRATLIDVSQRFPAARARNVRELARPPRHSDAKRSGRHCDYSGGHGAAPIENNVAVERAHSRRGA